MKHSFVDEYSGKDSFIHRLDPRTKFITTLVLIFAAVITPVGHWQTFGLYLVMISLLILLSGVPILYILKRSLIIIPFVVIVAISIPFLKEGTVAASYNIGGWHLAVTYDGLLVFGTVLAKSWLAILALILLTATTGMTDLLKGLEELHLPRVMVMILSFMYRYIFVLADEVLRMKQARDSRNFGGRRLWQIKTIGNMIGTLFIRSYEHGERVYSAMLARGYDGQNRTLKRLAFKPVDAYFGASFGLVLIVISVAGFLKY